MEQKRKVLPLVYLLLTLVLMTGFHFLLPIASVIPAPFSYAGVVFVIAGIAVAAVAAGAFHKAGMPLIPFEPSTALGYRRLISIYA